MVSCSSVPRQRAGSKKHRGRSRKEIWWRTSRLQSCCSSSLSSSSSRSCRRSWWHFVLFHTTSSFSTSTSPTTSLTQSFTHSWTRYSRGEYPVPYVCSSVAVTIFIAHQHANSMILIYHFCLSDSLSLSVRPMLILCRNYCTNPQTFYISW